MRERGNGGRRDGGKGKGAKGERNFTHTKQSLQNEVLTRLTSCVCTSPTARQEGTTYSGIMSRGWLNQAMDCPRVVSTAAMATTTSTAATHDASMVPVERKNTDRVGLSENSKNEIICLGKDQLGMQAPLIYSLFDCSSIPELLEWVQFIPQAKVMATRSTVAKFITMAIHSG